MKMMKIAYQEMPVNIVAFYVKVRGNTNIVINTHYDLHTQILGFLGCLYFEDQKLSVAKITIDDIIKPDYEPIVFAKEQLDSLCVKE